MKYLKGNNYMYYVYMILLLTSISSTISFGLRNLQFNDPNCNLFQSNGFCQKCSQRFYMNINTKLCTKISDSCASWNINNGNCLSCYLGYTLQKNGQCIQGNSNQNAIQVSNCIQYIQDLNNKQNRKICSKCNNGYYLDNNKQCQLLPINCMKSNQNGYCIQCITNYQVSNGVCIMIPLDNCAQYTLIYSSLLNWLFNRGGKRVCKNCISGYYRDSNYVCQVLPKYCTNAIAAGTCTQCIKDYKIINGACFLDQCVQYEQVYDSIIDLLLRRSRKVCKNCRSGFYLNSNNNCITLPKNCLLGSQNGACIECEKSFKLQNGLCHPQVCSQYQYLISANNYCYRCKNTTQVNFLCLQLPLNCISLKIPELSCSRCIQNFMLKNGICIPIDKTIQ